MKLWLIASACVAAVCAATGSAHAQSIVIAGSAKLLTGNFPNVLRIRVSGTITPPSGGYYNGGLSIGVVSPTTGVDVDLSITNSWSYTSGGGSSVTFSEPQGEWNNPPFGIGDECTIWAKASGIKDQRSGGGTWQARGTIVKPVM